MYLNTLFVFKKRSKFLLGMLENCKRILNYFIKLNPNYVIFNVHMYITTPFGLLIFVFKLIIDRTIYTPRNCNIELLQRKLIIVETYKNSVYIFFLCLNHFAPSLSTHIEIKTKRKSICILPLVHT